MTGLVEWLRVQLDEDERLALAAEAVAPSPWRWADVGSHAIHDADGVIVALPTAVAHSAEGRLTHDFESHLAAWCPARVLAEVAAKRTIVEMHGSFVGRVCDRCSSDWATTTTMPCLTVRVLASVYADRPGFLEEWRP